MVGHNVPESQSSSAVSVNAPRLWGGGLATACVAALTAFVGVLIFRDVLDVKLARPAFLLGLGDSFSADYASTAFIGALAATALAHVLSLTTPRPRTFFSWILGLATLAAAAVPFAGSGRLTGQVGAAVTNLAIGICIGSLLTAVLSRTVFDTEASWQDPAV